MLVQDSIIRITAEGDERPVQDLSIADRIFNPFTEGYDEITDILQRRVPMCDKRSRTLAPVLIGKGELFSGRPRHDLRLSPWQLVMMTDPRRAANGPTGLSCYPAKDISSDRLPAEDIIYFAIFFDRPRFVEVSGVLVQTYTLEDICHV